MKSSESIKEISKAIIAFHSKVPKIKKEATNPFFKNKYASLSNILEVVSIPLNECGLAILQLPAGMNQLETILLHESGEFISETYEMKPSKQDPQGQGSAITYQRRYALGAILSLNIDEDDDGNKASEPVKIAKKEPVIMPDDRFQDMMKGLTKDNAGKWIAAARKNYIFSDDQENILRQWEENLKTE
jgi:hypothetical protein